MRKELHRRAAIMTRLEFHVSLRGIAHDFTRAISDGSERMAQQITSADSFRQHREQSYQVTGREKSRFWSYARFSARLNDPLSASIFFCSWRIANNTASGRGGQPGTYTSTGIT
jgi:hypothetical protein